LYGAFIPCENICVKQMDKVIFICSLPPSFSEYSEKMYLSGAPRSVTDFDAGTKARVLQGKNVDLVG